MDIKNPKIVLVSNTSWSIYNFRLGLIRSLLELGYDVVAVAPRDNFTSKLIAEGIDFKEIYLQNYGTSPLRDLGLFSQLLRIYKSVNPDLIFHYTIKPNIYGSIASFICKKPSIFVITGLGHLFEFSNIFIRWITLFLYRIAALLSKEVWFLNDNDRDVFVYKRIVGRKKTRLLRGEGVDTTWFKPRKDKKFNLPIRFLFAGRILWDKGIQEFVDAAKIIKERHPYTRFEILGFIDQGNPNSVPYEKISQWQKEKTIKYLGETTDVRQVLEKASCLVFPSFYREGVSRILMEAAAMETPIITTDNVGCRDVVEHGKTGFLADVRNVNSLVNCIEEFIEMSSQDQMVMGKLGRQKMIREFEEAKILEFYIQAIKSFISNPGDSNSVPFLQTQSKRKPLS